MIDGLVARVRADAVEAPRATPGVQAVTADATVELLGKPRTEDWADTSRQGKPYNHGDDPASLYNVGRAIGADDAWGHRVTGQGVGVAVIDSGVAPVRGLAGRV